MFQSVLDTPRPDSMPFQTSIASRAQIGVALQQPRWKLFSQPHWKSLHNRYARAGEFASFKSRASDTRYTFARVRAFDNEEGFIEVVNLNWAASDTTSVLESAPARGAMDANKATGPNTNIRIDRLRVYGDEGSPENRIKRSVEQRLVPINPTNPPAATT
ncbi:hypothetical protein P692DRAFT_20873533 [Suillus brevipes Sb2]|nr:hypothetical protein P692DRAFT_20873533 [Suillus brevipes Sb2]